MKRIFAMLATVAIALGLAAPVALAAEPIADTGQVLVAINRSVEISEGDRLDMLVVLGGDARISGDVGTIVVAGGTATLAGATTETVVVVNGTAELQAGTTVIGDVRTLDGTVTQAPGTSIGGSVRTLDADLAAIGVLLVPALILLMLGFGLAAVAAALLVAAFAARQVRSVGALMVEQPGHVLVAGIAGALVLPLLAILLIATMVGAPIGFALLFVLLPVLGILGWLVAAIWIGDWIIARTRGTIETGRPYLAAVVGVIVLSVAGVVPFVSAIATLFGFGALLLAAWRTFRHGVVTTSEAGAPQPTASAG